MKVIVCRRMIPVDSYCAIEKNGKVIALAKNVFSVWQFMVHSMIFMSDQPDKLEWEQELILWPRKKPLGYCKRRPLCQE